MPSSCQHFVAHKSGGEERKPGLQRGPGASGQVLFADDARQLMHQHDRIDAGGANQRQNVTGGRGVDDGVGESLLGQGFQLDAQGRLGGRDGQRGNLLVGVLQLAAIQQQELDVHAETAAQDATLSEQIVLRATGESVVSDQQQPRGSGAARQTGDGSGGRVQVGRPVVQVGFQIGALTPFVPGIDADDWLAEKRLLAGGLAKGSPAIVRISRARSR